MSEIYVSKEGTSMYIIVLKTRITATADPVDSGDINIYSKKAVPAHI